MPRVNLKNTAGKKVIMEIPQILFLSHGLFIPLKIMYPDADIPCVQLSLLGNLDPAQHVSCLKVIE
jgi:aromatic ring-opening dioxygenase catalytic subunit (LigB family)